VIGITIFLTCLAIPFLLLLAVFCKTSDDVRNEGNDEAEQ